MIAYRVTPTNIRFFLKYLRKMKFDNIDLRSVRFGNAPALRFYSI